VPSIFDQTNVQALSICTQRTRQEHRLILTTGIVAVIGAGGEEQALSARPSRLFQLLGDFA
jgi:hypothetical protein